MNMENGSLSRMNSKRIKIIICTFLILFISFCAFIVYNFSVHNIIIMGQHNKIYFTSVTELDLRKNRLSRNEEQKLKYFTNLKYLNLRMNEIDSVDFVEYMPDLERFEFMGSRFSFGILSPDDLSGQVISYSPNLKPIDYTPLKKLKKLKMLCISGTYNNDISFLKELPSLEYLQIDAFDLNEEMISCISSLNCLKSLSLCNASFVSTKFLKELKKLKNITLYDCNIEEIDVSDFMTLPELEEIALLGTHIEQIDKLAQIKSLKVIRIGNESYDESELKTLRNKGIVITN